MKISNFFPLIFFFVLALLLVHATDMYDKPNFLPSLVGREMPQFEVRSLDEKTTLSNKDFEDITIVNLFASWCMPCKIEHPLFIELAKEHKIYGINIGDTKEDLNKYLDTHGNPYAKIGFDPKRQVMIGLGSTGVPETFIVDKTGKIYFHMRGMIDREIVEKQMLPIIEGMKRK